MFRSRQGCGAIQVDSKLWTLGDGHQCSSVDTIGEDENDRGQSDGSSLPSVLIGEDERGRRRGPETFHNGPVTAPPCHTPIDTYDMYRYVLVNGIHAYKPLRFCCLVRFEKQSDSCTMRPRH
jgi:hypothetical protein